jgi:catechol 2,3-dioxygenase-like lactoylglutathione lyase family enzyme
MTRLNLVVIRVADLDKSRLFYEQLGLKFEQHQHGKGPIHFACEKDDIVFEIYQSDTAETINTRLGFIVDDLDKILDHVSGESVLVVPKQSEWGYRTVIIDPDGHKVELVQKDQRKQELEKLVYEKLGRNFSDEEIMDLLSFEKQMVMNREYLQILQDEEIITEQEFSTRVGNCFMGFLKKVLKRFGADVCRDLYDFVPGERAELTWEQVELTEEQADFIERLTEISFIDSDWPAENSH